MRVGSARLMISMLAAALVVATSGTPADAKAQIFADLLPYAIVFGCVSLWAKAFEAIDTSATTSQYEGSGFGGGGSGGGSW